ncbi:MAG: PEP-utilizing enzyme [archaeon]|jgi:pyruvate,water dikinase
MILRGIGVSSGIVKGKVKFYSNDAFVSEDDIFVAYSTNPSMAHSMARAKAIITQRGGILSHAAIFCRELGIPCVVGVEGLLDKIMEGTEVIVDGEKGTIEVVN